jgi:hypothetical protein
MEKYFKIPMYDLIKVCNNNPELVKAYLKGDIVEHDGDGNVAFGLGIGAIVMLLVIGLTVFIWSIWALITYGKYMPKIAFWICVILLIVAFFFGGSPSIIVLIVVYASKGNKKLW